MASFSGNYSLQVQLKCGLTNQRQTSLSILKANPGDLFFTVQRERVGLGYM